MFSSKSQIKYDKKLPNELLQMYRKRANLTQTQLGELIGLQSKRAVQSWEVGENVPKSERLKQLIELYWQRQVFIAGQEHLEARQLWDSVKDMYDASNQRLLTYPVFDNAWFEALPLKDKVSETTIKAVEPVQSNSLAVPTNRLPIAAYRLIGREHEVAELCAMLLDDTNRLVTLSGAGGIGKTRLGLQVAANLLESLEHRVWLVELAALNNPSLVVQAIAGVLGVTEQRGKSLVNSISQHLSDKSSLLMLDNCEHLIEECASLVEQLLQACPLLTVLATSREGFNIRAERIYYVPPLSLPRRNEQKEVSVDELAAYAAIQLFVERGQEVNSKFALNAKNVSAVVEVCQKLDGIPLAIELATARLKVLTVEQIKERLNDRFQLLTSGKRTDLQRQQTLRTLIDWSYDLLPQKEQKLWQRFSVFTGSWRLAAAEQICWDEIIAEGEIFDLLNQLVNKSILVVEETEEAEFRYRMLETIREYGKEQLKTNQEKEKWHKRHLDFFLTLTEENEAKLMGTEQSAAIKSLESELDNLRTSLNWAIEAGYSEFALRLCNALSQFWLTRGYFSEGRGYLERALGLNSSSEPALRGKSLKSLTMLTLSQGDYFLARKLAEESLDLFKELGEHSGQAHSLRTLGVVAYHLGEEQTAQRYLQESVALFRQVGNKPEIADALSNLANVVRAQEGGSVAQSYYEESLIIYRELGVPRGIAMVLTNLGFLMKNNGDYLKAQIYLEESLRLFQELGDKRGIATVLNTLGLILDEQTDYEAAYEYLIQSLECFRQLDHKQNIAYVLNSLTVVSLSLGKFEAARREARESLQILRPLQDRRGVISILSRLLGVVLSITPNQEQPPEPANLTVPTLLTAARVCGAISNLVTMTNLALSQIDGPIYERVKQLACDGLEQTAFTTAFAEGAAMSLDEAIEYALTI